jgi:hypothetical protein
LNKWGIHEKIEAIFCVQWKHNPTHIQAFQKKMNTELLNRLVRIQFELNSIMMELASQPSSSPITETEKKGRGRPRKEKKERDPNKPKKVLSPEHLAKLKEGRERHAAEKAAATAAAASSDDAQSVASSNTEEGEVKEAPPAPKKARGRPRKSVEVPPAPDFSAAEESE